MKLRFNERPIYFPIAATMLVFLLAAIGLVSSFGSTADVGGSSPVSTLQQYQQQQPVELQQHRRQRTQPITSTVLSSSLSTTGSTPERASTASLFRDGSTTRVRASSLLSASSRSFSAEQPSSIPQGESQRKRTLLRRILWNANPLSGRNDDRWKGGETTATLASRLVFSYVSPLLDIVANSSGKKNNRTLTEEDAFKLKEQWSMNSAVESLASTYDSTRMKARRSLEEKRNNSDSRNNSKKIVKNSETLILLKALIRNQKSTLLLTGILRFINTSVQAFPSLLVARLLRSIEAGPSAPVQESLKASILLVGVLCLKMITENQYFHNVVNMATNTRGTIEGLIFDKSLRLPEGGSGVLTKDDFTGANSNNNGDKSQGRKGKPKKALGSGGVRCVETR